MERVGSSEDLLIQQSVYSHLPLFQRTVRSPGQDLIQLEGQDTMTAGTHWTETNNRWILQDQSLQITLCSVLMVHQHP